MVLSDDYCLYLFCVFSQVPSERHQAYRQRGKSRSSLKYMVRLIVETFVDKFFVFSFATLTLSLSVCLSVCLSVYLSVLLSLSPSFPFSLSPSLLPYLLQYSNFIGMLKLYFLRFGLVALRTISKNASWTVLPRSFVPKEINICRWVLGVLTHCSSFNIFLGSLFFFSPSSTLILLYLTDKRTRTHTRGPSAPFRCFNPLFLRWYARIVCVCVCLRKFSCNSHFLVYFAVFNQIRWKPRL